MNTEDEKSEGESARMKEFERRFHHYVHVDMFFICHRGLSWQSAFEGTNSHQHLAWLLVLLSPWLDIWASLGRRSFG